MTPENLKAYLAKALCFDEYLQLTNDIVTEKIPRANLYLAENTFRYTRSNLERMNKVLEQTVLQQKLYNLLDEITEEWIWLVITEPWCGDASWGTPALYVISLASEKIDFKILLRDENPELIKAFQTAGSDSIPKLICIRKKDMQVLGTWGPRPKILQQLVVEKLSDSTADYKQRVREIHEWYNADDTQSMQEELVDLVKAWKTV